MSDRRKKIPRPAYCMHRPQGRRRKAGAGKEGVRQNIFCPPFLLRNRFDINQEGGSSREVWFILKKVILCKGESIVSKIVGEFSNYNDTSISRKETKISWGHLTPFFDLLLFFPKDILWETAMAPQRDGIYGWTVRGPFGHFCLRAAARGGDSPTLTKKLSFPKVAQYVRPFYPKQARKYLSNPFPSCPPAL